MRDGAEPALNGAVDFVGPFQYHAVVVNGHEVPHLYATPLNGGMVHINLDHRLGIDLTVEEAERVLPFVADCIAVASGYTCHPHPELPDPPQRPTFVRVLPLS